MDIDGRSWEYSFIQMLPLGAYVYQRVAQGDDFTLHMVAINAPAERMIGLTSAELLGRTIDDCFPDLAPTGFPKRLIEAITTTTGFEEELVYGDERVAIGVFHIHAFPLPDACIGVLFSTSTIDAQTRAALIESRQREKILMTLLDAAPDAIILVSYDVPLESGHEYANVAYSRMLGYGDDTRNTPIAESFVEPLDRLIEIGRAVATDGVWQGEMHYRRKDGTIFLAYVAAFIIRDDAGKPIARGGIIHDLTREQQEEQERAHLQEQIIAAQQASLREVSTPLLPVAEGVIVMPLVGVIDRGRSQQILEVLLLGIGSLHAEIAILDITGVRLIDTQIANGLLRVAKAATLLGAQIVITGIQPEVAQTMVGLGVDLGRIITRSTLKDGIDYALHR